MTIASTTSKVSYNGSGSVGPFPITFKFTKNADITATKRSSAGVETVLALTTDYTLTGAGDAAGGSLALTVALAVGESLVIARAPRIVQEVDYVENSAFPAETHESALDLLTTICQSLQEQVDRAVKVEISSTTDPAVLLAQLSADAVSAAASAATAATQAGLATSAKTAAVSARDDASDFADTASSGAGVITANLTAINNITANLTAIQGAAANASTASAKASEASASAASASSSAASAAASAASATAIVKPSAQARAIGGDAYRRILGIVCPPSLEVMAYDHQGAVNGVPPGFAFTRASTATAFGPDGQLYTAEAGEVRHEWDALTGEYKGWLLEGQSTNYLLNSGTPATQSVSLAAGTYTLWVVGSGSCTLSGGPTGTATSASPATFTLDVTTTVTFTVSGSLTRFQCEPLASPTSYIPTTSAQVTRAADSLSIATSAFPFNVGKGAFFLEFVVPPSGSLRGIFTIGNSYGTNFYASSNSGSVSIYGPAGVVLANIAKTAGAVCRVAICWNGSTASCAVDGVSTATGLACAAPSSVTALMLGILWDGAYPMGSHFKHVMAFPHPLSSAELALLTK